MSKCQVWMNSTIEIGKVREVGLSPDSRRGLSSPEILHTMFRRCLSEEVLGARTCARVMRRKRKRPFWMTSMAFSQPSMSPPSSQQPSPSAMPWAVQRETLQPEAILPKHRKIFRIKRLRQKFWIKRLRLCKTPRTWMPNAQHRLTISRIRILRKKSRSPKRMPNQSLRRSKWLTLSPTFNRCHR